MNTDIKIKLVEIMAAKGYKNVADTNSEDFLLYKHVLSNILTLADQCKITNVRLQEQPFGCDTYLSKFGEYIIYEQLTDVLNIYINASFLFDTLTKLGHNVRVSDTKAQEQEICGGTAVVVVNQECYKSVKPYSIGIVGGGATPLGTGNSCDITFSYSAYKDNHCCSCSGGPGTIATPFECLRPTGVEIEISFWRFKNGYRMPNNAEYYKEFVPLFEYYQSEADALVQKVQITKERYDELLNVVPPIYVSCEKSFYNDWARNEIGQALYWVETGSAFAVSEAYDHTNETVVVSVCFKEKYRKFEANQWVKAKEPAYFEQLMLLYTPSFKPIGDTYMHNYGKGYEARKYYKHSEQYIKDCREREEQRHVEKVS